MKKTLPALAVSLAANAALLALLLLRPPSSPSAPAGASAPTSATGAAPATRSADSALSPADLASLTRSRELLATDDLPALVARLRAAGFPPRIVRAIVTARVVEMFGAKRNAVIAQQEVVPYWRNAQGLPDDPKAVAEVARLFREQAALLKELLGRESDTLDEWSRHMHQRQFGYLPPEKVERLETIGRDYQEMRSAVYSESRGVMLPEDREKLAMLEREQRADLERLFTSEELEAYDLRSSNTANQLRSQLSAFKPTEEEFRAIFRLTRAASPGQSTTVIGMGGDGGPPRVSDLQKQIEAALGPERAAAYKMTTDPDYQQIDRLATRLELPPTVVPQVFSIGQEIQQRARALQTDRSLAAPGARASQLAALAAEAEAKLVALLGRRGYEGYQTQGGQWLASLPRNPTPGKN
jgi:hypothetical protein